MVAALMGARASLGHTGGTHPDAYQADRQAAERKKRTAPTAESFDRPVADEMGPFFDEVFPPTTRKLVEAGLDYDEVKRLVKIPGEQFKERARSFLIKQDGA
jgi:hypothetical protein